MGIISRFLFIALKGWLAIAKLKPHSPFISLLIMLEKAFYYVKIKKIKSESGFSFAIASKFL